MADAPAEDALSVLAWPYRADHGRALADPVAPAEVAAGIPADLLRRRPDVRGADGSQGIMNPPLGQLPATVVQDGEDSVNTALCYSPIRMMSAMDPSRKTLRNTIDRILGGRVLDLYGQLWCPRRSSSASRASGRAQSPLPARGEGAGG